MSEVPLYGFCTRRKVQGYLAHEKTQLPRGLLGLCLGTHGGPGGVRFLICEVPLYTHYLKAHTGFQRACVSKCWYNMAQVGPMSKLFQALTTGSFLYARLGTCW